MVKRVDCSKLTFAETGLLLCALDDYIEKCTNSHNYCAENNLEDLGRMWKARKEITIELRKEFVAE